MSVSILLIHLLSVWLSCSFPSCARCLYFLPVSFVLSRCSSREILSPSAYCWCPLCSLILTLFPHSALHLPSSTFPHAILHSSCVTCHCHSFYLYPHSLSPDRAFLPDSPLLSPSLTHSSRCLSPQDSTGSMGSAELIGIKELDDLSQEIAQLQRWAPAPWAAGR